MKDIDIENAVARVLSGYIATPATAPTSAPDFKPATEGCGWAPTKPADPTDDIIGGILPRALAARNCSCCKASDCKGTAGCLSISDAEAVELGDGVFATMDAAIEAAAEAQKQYLFCTMADRKRFVEGIRAAFTDQEILERISRLTVEQTGMGNLGHKIIKNRLAAEKTPGVEDLTTEAQSGDDGLTLVELSPFGVIGAITPTTNPTETVICNSIGMLAAGNAAVFSPHPRAKGVSLLAIKLINRKLAALGAPANLVVTVQAPSIENTNAMMAHPKVRMLVATGGPGIVRTVMSTGKKAIGAGAGNPPVVVDETADIPKAAQDIVNGASFDNNMPCIAEKEVIVVDQAADFLISEMQRNGAYLVTEPEVLKNLEARVLTEKGGPQTDCVGKSAAWLLQQVGIKAAPEVRLILLEAKKDHPFVQEELMMPILPVVRVPNVDEAIDLAVDLEHGNRHTAIMHSTNVRKLTKMAKLIQTTIFVKNGPSYAGIGVGGEGYTTFTIAGPTGEGLTSPRSFARRRKCVMVEALNVR
ncbi:aldehyde dehydrogenase EutE [Rhodobacter sp. TJ_12]|uniref:aldehyde dehydrogenase family protein n=1 Tax=Rhodobacter sp. TJ_12 TaxID=2029399 RepID=UPI001CC025FC|nr:aldehyde dehydrogenase family protein [Rhodobacter sp. TJ_12]MBZ4023189.1 aldehyde dehydrogenase EutE [Rhodobacter sp. TJ_12]